MNKQQMKLKMKTMHVHMIAFKLIKRVGGEGGSEHDVRSSKALAIMVMPSTL
jgi:hypothetical protein